MNFFQKFRDFVSQPTHKRTLGIVIMLVLAAAVSLTVVLSQQQQTIRQRAAEPAEQLAKGYVLCGDGLQQCQNGITVNASCDEGKSKCLSSTANFSGSDRINGKSLTCCLSDRYREVDGVCTLVTESYSISLNESPICNSPEKPKPTEPKESDYPLCWGGSPNGPNLLQCESGVTVDTPCSSEEFNKCLSAHKVRDADRIDGKYLTCCKAKEYGLVNDKCTLVADGEYSDPQCKKGLIAPTPSLVIGSALDAPKNILNFSFNGFSPNEAVTISYSKDHSTTVTADPDGAGAGSIWISKAGEYTLTATGEDPARQVSTAATAGEDRIDHATEGYVPCDNRGNSGLTCSAAKIGVSCQGKEKKCLAKDAINNESLVCCNGTNYDLVDDVCTLTRNDATRYNPNACTPPNPPEGDPNYVAPIAAPIPPTGNATLTIKNPDSITTGGSLEYSFAGFQPGNIDVWVTKRGQDERTGGIANATAGENGSGNSTILGLTELAGKYTLWAKGSNGVSANADFTVKPTLTIKNPDSITEKGSLEYSFAGFRSDEAVKIWVVDSPTGYVINKQADASGKGNYTVDGLSELPRTWTLKIEGETPERSATASFTVIAAAAPAPGDTVITLPAGAFNYLFTDTKKAVPELKTSKDQSLTIYLYSSDVDPKNDLRGENAIKKTHESKLSNSEENPLSFNLGQVPAGTYKILLKSPKYLRALEDTRTITSAGGTIILALTKPLANGAGDANGDNSIDILDYNIIQGCIGIRADAICTDREGADVNDSGVANEIDFNVWKTSMSFKDGD